ncbi:uncharacterized protein LOC141659560 isoform X2 [Apium graveolens]|uniref:uncharacterized protein LOC141659560 isoform X2 n=1 Tax=Apium graveolens TaxID=4045 RepID=UPI003D7A7E5C
MNTLVSHHHISVVCSLRRHHRRRRNSFPQQPPPTTSTDSNNLQLTIDLVSLSPLSLQTRLNKLLTTSTDAYNDLKTLVQIDSNKHVRISCKKSTVTFLIHVLVCGIVVALGFRVLGKLVKLFKSRGSSLREAVVTRRDRSLGGKEVVVGNVSRGRVLESPLESREFTGGMFKGITRNWGKTKGNRLPDWWPKSTSVSVSVGDDNEEYQRQANRLIRAIMDYRMSGKDIWMDDVVQLRQVCRISGVKVNIDTANSRDSLYRASVDFVLNICSNVPDPSAFVQIIGEDAREFIAGLADNIVLEKDRAARMVTAAVAARTRSWLLQAWPEMEMVARGLEKHLKLEQREYLMNLYVEVCGDETHRSVAEALGLPLQTISPESLNDRRNEYTQLN